MRPQDYATRILVAVTGLSPQIVTETLYALAVAPVPSEPRFVPTRIRLITTEEGAKESLLNSNNRWFLVEISKLSSTTSSQGNGKFDSESLAIRTAT